MWKAWRLSSVGVESACRSVLQSCDSDRNRMIRQAGLYDYFEIKIEGGIETSMNTMHKHKHPRENVHTNSTKNA